MEYIKVSAGEKNKIEKLSALASHIVKKHYDPILGSEQNDYMIEKFQSVHAIDEQLGSGYNYYIVRDDNGNDAGFIGFFPRGGGMYLSKFYLLEEQRGKGYSRKMLEFLIQKSKDAGFSSITLNVNKYNFAKQVYEKLGFHKIRDEKIDIGHGYFMDDYVYELKF